MAFTYAIVSIARKIQARLMQQTYSHSQRNWSGGQVQML